MCQINLSLLSDGDLCFIVRNYGMCDASRFNYLQVLPSSSRVCWDKYQPLRFLRSNPADSRAKLETPINQVSASGESIIYVRSGSEFRSFNSSVTFVSGLGRTRHITHIGNLCALPSCHLIHRKVSQSKFSELFMTSVARCNSPSSERVTTYTFILSLLQRSIHLHRTRPFPYF